MHHAAVGQLPETRHAFVQGVVDLKVLTLQVLAALPPVIEPDEKDPGIVLWAVADQQGIALHPAGFIDQGRGGWPLAIVEHGLVQRRQDTFECILVTHAGASLSGSSSGVQP